MSSEFNNGTSRAAVMAAERAKRQATGRDKFPDMNDPKPRADRFCTCECDRDDCWPTDYSRCLRCVLECNSPLDSGGEEAAW